MAPASGGSEGGSGRDKQEGRAAERRRSPGRTSASAHRWTTQAGSEAAGLGGLRAQAGTLEPGAELPWSGVGLAPKWGRGVGDDVTG